MVHMKIIAWILASLIAMNTAPSAPSGGTPGDVKEAARQGYLFAYPLVLMDETRKVALSRQPANSFNHAQAFPDDRFRAVVRPNADTLYSSAWLDLSKEPVLLHVPDTHGRYYLMQIMDAWTETIASPGKRTTGTSEATFAIVGPGWKGTLPNGVKRIDCPTNMAWVIGRTQTNSAADYENVHAIQSGYTLSTLSGTKAMPSTAVQSASVPPPVAVERMTPDEFFARYFALVKDNPAHAADRTMVQYIESIQGHPELIAAGVEEARTFLKKAMQPALHAGWGTGSRKVGVYGADFEARALVARFGLGALAPDDAIYQQANADGEGKALDGASAYLIHFEKGKLPPVNAFWSLTMYDDMGYFIANPIHRYAIGDRDKLVFNPDGSLDIRIQKDPPAEGDKANWLPAPTGRFNLSLRMYWPGADIVSGKWKAPAPVVVCTMC